MARAIVCVTNDLYTDQRVNKVCVVLMEQGYDVLLVGRKRRKSPAMNDRPYKTHRMRLLFEKGALFYAFFNIRLFLFLLVRKATLIVSNDLDTLLACYTAKKLKLNTRIVYDSHEYFTEVPELINRPRIQRVWERIEKRIFPKLETVYTVNQSIAALYKEKYNKEIRVIRNISPQWQPTSIETKKELGIPENKPLIIIQGAGINVDRGAEEAVEAMLHVDAVLLIVGDGDVVPELKRRSKELSLQEKVLFFKKQPYERMMNYTWYADIGLTLDKPTSLNYKYSLPNKVFDYIHTRTAVIATEIIEVANVVRGHEVGIILNDLNPQSLATAINSLINHPDRLNQFKTNCEKAALTENWEHEKLILQEIYPKINAE